MENYWDMKPVTSSTIPNFIYDHSPLFPEAVSTISEPVFNEWIIGVDAANKIITLAKGNATEAEREQYECAHLGG